MAANIAPTVLSEKTHPYYGFADGDLKLISSGGDVAFYVHSVILRLASPVFADMLSMPQGSVGNGNDTGESLPKDANAVKLTEDSETIAALLDFIYPRRPKPKLTEFNFAQRLADAADKYDLLDVTDIIRSNLRILGEHTSPLYSYALACRYGWLSEVNHLSSEALALNIDDPKVVEIMGSLDPHWVLKFLSFRRRRCIAFREALNIHYSATAPEERRLSRLRWECISSQHSDSCRSQGHNRTYWTAFKMMALSKFEEDATGHSLIWYSPFWAQACLTPIMEEKCSKCSTRFFEVSTLSSEMIRIIADVLPQTMD